MNGEAMAAFMEGFQRTKAMMDSQRLQRDELGMRRQDRQQVLTRQSEQDRIAAEQRARQEGIQNEDRQRSIALQGMQVPGNLAELGGTANDPSEAQRLIESMMPAVLKAFGPEALAYGQPAVEMAQRTITARQKKDVERFVEQAIKTSFIADNPDADPVITNLPAHVQKAIGKSDAKLSELQGFAELPVGKPATTKTAANPTEASIAMAAAGGDPMRAFGMLNPPPKPERAPRVGKRWLVQGDGEPFEWPEDQPAPRGSRPFDPVAARQSGGPGAGQPSAYSTERAARTIESVDALMSKVSRRTTGIGSLLSGVPESEARNFKAELDTLKANIAFNELTAMREASKTGGALGAVSDKEMNLLQSALGALDAGQSPENIKAQLAKIKQSVQRWQAANNAPNQGASPPPRPGGAAQAARRNPFRP